jgi:hypothetical protein
MTDPDPYAGWSLADRLQMLAFEAELAHLPRSLITALWEALDRCQPPNANQAQRARDLVHRPLSRGQATFVGMSRQARLRAAYQDWYPAISLEVWHDAAWLMEKVLQQLRHGSPSWALRGRSLSDLHFDFQGQSPQPRKAHRMGDDPAGPPYLTRVPKQSPRV